MLPGQGTSRSYSLVDTHHQGIGIILGATDNAGVGHGQTVQAFEVATVEGKNTTPRSSGTSKNVGVISPLFAGFLDGQNIMAERT